MTCIVGHPKMSADLGSALMEAFQRLRNDNVVQTAATGSRRRQARIDAILSDTACHHGVSQEDLAMELAKSLGRD